MAWCLHAWVGQQLTDIQHDASCWQATGAGSAVMYRLSPQVVHTCRHEQWWGVCSSSAAATRNPASFRRFRSTCSCGACRASFSCCSLGTFKSDRCMHADSATLYSPVQRQSNQVLAPRLRNQQQRLRLLPPLPLLLITHRTCCHIGKAFAAAAAAAACLRQHVVVHQIFFCNPTRSSAAAHYIGAHSSRSNTSSRVVCRLCSRIRDCQTSTRHCRRRPRCYSHASSRRCSLHCLWLV
ncbi:hypothetical protein COO60DRAFT_410654 [Scenedesmus sp. NREL 46B-D3]|nr:hypothetical protein COO60DRAFT_410654 [Scenedesmus sp. NREL 46B-D3]